MPRLLKICSTVGGIVRFSDAGFASSGLSDQDAAMAASTPNRRGADRLGVPRLVYYRTDARAEGRWDYAENWSTGGLFLSTEEPASPGGSVYLSMCLGARNDTVEAEAKVVRVGTYRGKKGMALRFVSLDSRARGLLESVVASAEPSVEGSPEG